MRPVIPALLSLAALVAGVSCSSTDSAPPAAGADASPEVDAGNPSKADSIAFESESTLTLGAGEKTTLRVQVQPPGEHQVRFSLVGDSLDGSLDSDLLLTTQEGKAAVVLTAPHSATTFRVRAVADDGPSAETAVSVSGTGFATVKVTPKYSGIRSAPTWTVTGAALVACSDKKGIPPADGPIAVTLESGTPLVLEGLPAGAKLAVTVRSGHALGGCADVAALNPGEQRSVDVKVLDRPIELAQTDLAVHLLMTPDGTAVKPWLDAEASKFVTVFAPEGSEAVALLDAMQDAANNASEFASLRQQEGWDEAAKAYFTALGKPLADRVRGWAAKGSISMLGGNALTGRIKFSGSIPELHLDTVAGLDAASCGSSYAYTIVLSADPGDKIHIGGGIDLLPSQLIAAAADAAVKSSTVPDAVAAIEQVVACSDFAQMLDEAGTTTTACDHACLDQLCRQALANIWAIARSVSASTFDAAHLSFTASAEARVDDEAVIQKFEGSWAGELTALAQTIALNGTATGAVSR